MILTRFGPEKPVINPHLGGYSIPCGITTAVVADKLEALREAVRLKRKEEYPPMEDYLDGIAKGDTDQVNAYIAKCQAVKDKYPLP